MTQLEKRLAGLRIGRSAAVLEALVPTILAQRVIGGEASVAYRAMVSAAARPAPEPDPPLTWPDDPGVVCDAARRGLLVPQTPGWLASTPAWASHRWGVEHRRAETIKTVAAYAHRLGGVTSLTEARRRLGALPGIGPWTVRNVALIALGEPDAVNAGYYWLKHVVTFALTGEPRGTGERMLEPLEPGGVNEVGSVACCSVARRGHHGAGPDRPSESWRGIERDRTRPTTRLPLIGKISLTYDGLHWRAERPDPDGRAGPRGLPR